jgi:hypothetical protein
MAAILTALCILLILSQGAHAYIDPGSGSYFLQIALSVFLGTIYTVRVYWRRISSYLGALLVGRAD